jgi:5-methylthioadenosine/S-adenosylhomocysteine deaminase
MTIFRNYADDLAFDEWLFGRIMPKEDMLAPEDAYWCTLLACLEMIKSGTTCFLDMHMFKGQCLRAAAKSGMRAVLSRGIAGEGPDDPAAIRHLNELFEDEDACKPYGGRLRCALGPHAIYSCGERLLRHIAELAQERGMRVHIHLAETQNEFDTAMQKYGCTPTEYVARLGLFDAPAVAAHCVYLTPGDIDILKARGVNVAINSISNMKLGNGFAPADRLIDAGINVCIGTDGAASNNNLNLFKEMGTLSLIHKGLTKNPRVLPARRVLHCATAAGADALGLRGAAGILQPGALADIILLNLDCPQFQPINDIAASLVYAASGAEVETVLIDGQVVMEKGNIKTIDEERVYAEVARIRKALL